LCERIWGQAWFETGCLSAHYRNPAFEGEEVQANIEKPKPGQTICAIGMTKRGRHGDFARHGVGRRCGGHGAFPAAWRTEPLADPVILADLKVGMKDIPPDGQNGFRPAHGRPLSVFAGGES